MLHYCVLIHLSLKSDYVLDHTMEITSFLMYLEQLQENLIRAYKRGQIFSEGQFFFPPTTVPLKLDLSIILIV
jgi:hypothetical protein